MQECKSPIWTNAENFPGETYSSYPKFHQLNLGQPQMYLTAGLPSEPQSSSNLNRTSLLEVQVYHTDHVQSSLYYLPHIPLPIQTTITNITTHTTVQTEHCLNPHPLSTQSLSSPDYLPTYKLTSFGSLPSVLRQWPCPGPPNFLAPSPTSSPTALTSHTGFPVQHTLLPPALS